MAPRQCQNRQSRRYRRFDPGSWLLPLYVVVVGAAVVVVVVAVVVVSVVVVVLGVVVEVVVETPPAGPQRFRAGRLCGSAPARPASTSPSRPSRILAPPYPEWK